MPYDDDTGGGTVFRDVTLLALAGFVVIVLLLLPWLNPQGHEQETTTTTPGSVVVELFWPSESQSDVDLWVKAPQDQAVGYANMGGYFFNLLRDDLGQENDITPINYETSYSRGISSGEHVINLHLFTHYRNEGPITATVAVSVVEPGQRARTHLFQDEVVLERQGQELTVVRLSINKLGKLMANSVNHLQKSLLEPGKRIAYRARRRGPSQ